MNTTTSHKTRLSIANVRVTDAMTTGMISCTPDTPLRNVAKIMATRCVHAVYVFDYGSESDEAVQLWGLVSDLDVVAALRADLDERTAGESAVTPLVTIRSDDSVDRAAQLMAENGTSHLAVIDPATGRPAGVISSLDIARLVASDEQP